MAILLPIAQQGEGILSLTAAKVADHEFGSEWLKQLVAAMQDTMLARAGVGIAAPQVYVSKRVIIVASHPNARYPDAPIMQPIAMINPQILAFSAQTNRAEEGCLSVANRRAEVTRASQIKLEYLTLEGELQQCEFSGFPARIVQHEIDHLDGILFVDRLDISPKPIIG